MARHQASSSTPALSYDLEEDAESGNQSTSNSSSPALYPFTSETLRRLAAQTSSTYVSPYAPIPQKPGQQSSLLVTQSPRPFSPAHSASGSRTPGGSSVTGDTVFDSPGLRNYSPVAPNMSGKTLSNAERASLIKTLQTHRVNTLIELRRIEKVLASTRSPDVAEPLTQAWAHYVNSNNLLSELRGLTKNYPFSSECLDEAKWMVIGDPQSIKSWNYCWLVLQKAKSQNLIPKHARQLAANPAMWGGRTPTAQGIEQLTKACTDEWTRALNQLLRHWDAPPTMS